MYIQFMLDTLYLYTHDHVLNCDMITIHTIVHKVVIALFPNADYSSL